MRMTKYWLGFVLILATMTALWGQEKKQEENKPADQGTTAKATATQVPHTFVITPEQSATKNPVRFTDYSVEKGKKIYATQCAMCHGKDGDGKGDADLLAEIKASPPDFTKPDTLKKRTDGDLFTIITTGSDTMPGQTDRMQARMKWNVVNYLRSLTGKTPEKATEEERLEGTVAVPTKSDH